MYINKNRRTQKQLKDCLNEQRQKFDKTQPTFMIKKNLSKIGINSKFLKLIKHLYRKQHH